MEDIAFKLLHDTTKEVSYIKRRNKFRTKFQRNNQDRERPIRHSDLDPPHTCRIANNKFSLRDKETSNPNYLFYDSVTVIDLKRELP